MSLIRWNPFFADDMLADFFGNENKPLVPAMDVYEKDGKVCVEAPIPGFDPKDVKVSLENGVLTIKGGESRESEVDEKNYYRKEVRQGSFYRSVRLPVAVKEDKVEATWKGGVLTVSAPKKDGKEEKKSIEIKVEEI